MLSLYLEDSSVGQLVAGYKIRSTSMKNRIQCAKCGQTMKSDLSDSMPAAGVDGRRHKMGFGCLQVTPVAAKPATAQNANVPSFKEWELFARTGKQLLSSGLAVRLKRDIVPLAPCKIGDMYFIPKSFLKRQEAQQ